MDITGKVKARVERLLKKRQEIEAEREQVLGVCNAARYISPDLKETIRDFYSHKLALVKLETSDLMERLTELGGGSGG